MTQPTPTRAFLGSFTSAGGRGVIATVVDPGTGALTETGVSDVVADPSYLTLGTVDGRPVLYAVSETSEGGVAAFEVEDGKPRALGGRVPVCGASPTHLSVVEGHILTANYGSGSLSVLPIAADGAPGPVSGVLQFDGSGPDPDRQHGPHAHQVVPDPSGRWVLAVDLGTDTVHVCVLHAERGELTAHRRTALRPGTGPRHLAFHPDGRHAYVLNELEPTVTICRWDAEEGLLEPVAEAPVLPEGTEGRSYPSELAVAHDGRWLWVANRGHDSIAVLSLDDSGERAELVTTVPCGGRWPRDLVLDASGERLYAANERSGDVTWFTVDPATGVPERAGSFPAPAVSRVVFG
ncbi:lactonase family protein [Streptomyces sp. NPDC057638]|uniref:lactonase family protein n=1 Tax=Streptomyces sp. NPDC057638 TaxID=3346190 RepID=UPI003694229E